MGKNYRNRSSVVEVPKRAYEKDRLDAEMKVVGQFGLKNKREIRRVNLILSRLRKAARELLTLSEDDPKRIFEGAALMRRCFRLGLLSQEENKLDYILGLTIPKFMERRLQTVVLKSNFNARSIHHARVMIRQRHFRVGKQLVNVPSFMVRVDREKQIDFASTSPFGVGRPGRIARRNAKNKKGGEEDN